MTTADDDVLHMRRAIALARRQLGRTGSNPAVGCVLVRDGRVIGEAATADGGRPHAEEQTLAQAGPDAAGAVAYITLEPCGARSSGAPSCAERLAGARVSRVAIACEDPSRMASGRGLERLRVCGTPVTVGLLTDEAAELYADYLRGLAAPDPLA